jgi:hypothetical protein
MTVPGTAEHLEVVSPFAKIRDDPIPATSQEPPGRSRSSA